MQVSQQDLEALLQPFTRLFSDQRLKRHAKALIPGVIVSRSPHITKAMQDGGEPDVSPWAQAKRALFASRGRLGYQAGDGAYVAPDAAYVCGGVVSHVLCHPHPGMLAAGSPAVASMAWGLAPDRPTSPWSLSCALGLEQILAHLRHPAPPHSSPSTMFWVITSSQMRCHAFQARGILPGDAYREIQPRSRG